MAKKSQKLATDTKMLRAVFKYLRESLVVAVAEEWDSWDQRRCIVVRTHLYPPNSSQSVLVTETKTYAF